MNNYGLSGGMGYSNPWVISPEQRSNYERTFQNIGPMNGKLSGQVARGFFMKTGLPTPVLGQIWQLSDMDRDGNLTASEFCIAMHLVNNKLQKSIDPPTSLPQSLLGVSSVGSGGGMGGMGGGMSGLSGVMGMSMGGVGGGMGGMDGGGSYGRTSPAYSQTNYSSMPTSAAPMPKAGSGGSLKPIPHQTRLKYNQEFNRHDAKRVGYITGVQARQIFTRESRLPAMQLAQIWNLADNDQDGNLNREEFANAQHLIAAVKSGIALPSKLPPFMGGKSVLDTAGKDGAPDERITNFKQGQDLLNKKKELMSEQLEAERQAFLKRDMEEKRKRDQKFAQQMAQQQAKQQRMMAQQMEQQAMMQAQQREREAEMQRQRQENIRRETAELDMRRELYLDREQALTEVNQLLLKKTQLDSQLSMIASKRRQMEDMIQRGQKAKEQAIMEQEQATAQMQHHLLSFQQLESRYQTEMAALKSKQDERNNLSSQLINIHQQSAKAKGAIEGSKGKVDSVAQDLLQSINALQQSLDRNRNEISSRRINLQKQQDALRYLQDELTEKRRRRGVVSSAMDAEEQRKREVMEKLQEQQRQQEEAARIRREAERDRERIAQERIEERRKEREARQNLPRQESNRSWNESPADDPHITNDDYGRSNDYGRDNNDYGRDNNDYGRGNNDYGRDNNDYGRDNNDYGRDNNDYGSDYNNYGRSNDDYGRSNDGNGLDNDDYVRSNDNYEESTDGWGRASSTRRPDSYYQEDSYGADDYGKEYRNDDPYANNYNNDDGGTEEMDNDRRKEFAIQSEDVVAAFDYAGEKSDDLSFFEGDTITVTAKDPDGWWYGECAGFGGWFPSTYTNPIDGAVPSFSDDMLPPAPDDDDDYPPAPEDDDDFPPVEYDDTLMSGTVEGAVHYALYSYEGVEESDLNFKGGDAITIIEAPEDGWWKGECNGKVGYFPSNHVDPLPMSPEDVDALNIAPPMHEASMDDLQAANQSYDDMPAPPSEEPEPFPEPEEISSSLPAVHFEPHVKESSHGADSEQTAEWVQAIHPYTGTKDDELTLQPGDVFTVEQKDAEGWWEGTLNGKTGWFPQAYVEPVGGQSDAAASQEAVPTDTTVSNPFGAQEHVTPRPQKPMIAKVLEDYKAEDDTQLSLKKGALVSVTYQDDSGWWEGTISIKGKGKQSGWFPAAYTTLMGKSGEANRQSNAKSVVIEPSDLMATVMYDFAGTEADSLPVVAGDRVKILEQPEGEWWQGELNGKIGWIPSAFVELTK
eukprot:CFRG1053T1